MKSGLMEKLSSYAALIGVIGAIGGGFYTWGEFNNRLNAVAVLEEKVKKIEDRPASKDWSKDIEVLRKELEYIKLEIEELKLKSKNPLAG